MEFEPDNGNAIMIKRILVLLFGIFSYLLGVSALVGWILSMMGIMPFQSQALDGSSFTVVLLFMLALTLLFTIQHTIMARQSFKTWVTEFIPQAAERSLFVLATAVVLWIAIWFWPQDTQVVWSVSNRYLSMALTGFAIFGWAYLFIATFAINHFELFGLQQVFQHFQGKEIKKVPFKESLMYGFDRHPIMTGALIGMWSTPNMTADHLLFSLFFTAYVVFGVSIEERDLIKQWGDGYRDYKKRVKSIVPTF